MNKEPRAFLDRLLGTISPSGFEDEAAAVWRESAESFADEIRNDFHGNTIAVVNPGGSPRIMLAGHVDEIGFLAQSIDPEGFISFNAIGGWDTQVVIGQRVWIRTKAGRIAGVVGKKAVHLLEGDERKKVSEIHHLWIDIGAKNKKETEKLVEIGDPIVLAWDVQDLRNGLVVSRGMDDKAGAWVALEAARRAKALKPKAEVVAVATVQEEIGLRGATTSAFGIDPHIGIAIDVTFATDHPGMGSEKGKMGEVKLGKGPVIYRGPNINPRVFELLVETARLKKIKHQIRAAARGTGTDANAIQLARAGVATGLLSVPNRYMHSPCEIVSLDDLDDSADLLAQAMARAGTPESFVAFGAATTRHAAPSANGRARAAGNGKVTGRRTKTAGRR